MKVYKIEKTRINGKTEIIEGTLDELKNYFGYTFEIGCSWNDKIKRDPKTIKSFIKYLQMSYEEQEANCYNRTFVKVLD